MKYRLRGFTTVELFIVISIIAVLCLICFNIFTNCSSNKETAEMEAMEYGRSLGLDINGISCMKQDTDGDGYVSCSISYKNNDKISIMPIECANHWNRNDGCKSQKIGVTRHGL